MIGELDRRLANIVRFGTVFALDEAKALVQIELGDLVTDWLPWGTGRAGGNRSWDAPEVGEQVLLFAPSGELANAVVMGSIPQTAYPPPATSKDHTRYQWSDGAFQDYDRAGHHYVLDIPSAGDLTLHVGASTLKLTNGDITATIGASTLKLTSSDITSTIGGTTLKLEGGKATLTTPEFDVNAALSKFTGAVQITGAASVGAGLSVTGNSTMTGNLNTSGTITGGNVKQGSIDLAAHHHTAQGATAATTPAQP